ncbi:MAG: dTDP-4-dehydrorhamnose 3,5-epimerase [Elusimicrobiota bacterium]|jgi:dTDP-4-dehydrorhamnose 3,5-epimerase|nr:dTDP-4-dehydrorhamnose 3,5-epimerase [Elusimicrobiota bacterium]
MDFSKTPLEGLIAITPKVFTDARGGFFETYSKKDFAAAGINADFVQDNQSYSKRGVIRALHLQRAPHAQAKLVRVLQGRVFDVVVDLRPQSKTFGQWYGVELSCQNNKMLFIPRGLAHGFSVLSEAAVFGYKCDNFYNKESEAGIIYNDPDLNIDWRVAGQDAVVSDKDKLLPSFKAYKETL